MIRELWSNKWLAIKEMVDPERGVNGYTFSHEARCKGKILVILPFRKNGDNTVSFYLRREITPCWGMEPRISSITGGVENDDPLTTAMHELQEEAGYACQKENLIDLGTTYGVKSADTVYFIYGVDVTNLPQGKAMGDGSQLEAQASMVWTNENEVPRAVDPMVAMAYIRLKQTGLVGHMKDRFS